MKKLFVAAAALAFGGAAGFVTVVQAADAPPLWAYGFTSPPPSSPPAAVPAPAATPDNTTMHTLAGSKLQFTRAQIANRYGPADWVPEDHPAMPDIVAHGKESAQPQVYACSLSPAQRQRPSGECQHHRP